MRPTVAALIPVLVLGACVSDEHPSTGDVQVRDSAGVEIVTATKPADAYGAVGTIGDAPALELGSVEEEGPELFGSIRAIRSLPDGTLLVADGQALEIRVFDARGEHLRTIGGEGGGPGEFQAIRSIPRVSSDSIWVWDSRQRRLSVFDTAGAFLGATELQDSRPRAVSVFPDGTLLTRNRWFGSPMSSTDGIEFQRDSAVLIRHAPDGTPLDTVAVAPAGEMLRRAQVSGGLVQVQQTSVPVGRSFVHTLHPGGIVGGPNDTFQLLWWTPDGALERITRVPSLDRPLTSDDVSQLKERHIAASLEGRLELGQGIAFEHRLDPPQGGGRL